MASRFRSRVTGEAQPGVTMVGNRRSYMTTGARMSHFKDDSTTRKGIWSGLDTATYERNERAIASAPIGTWIQVLGADGTPIPGGVMEKDGRVLRGDKDGKIRVYDAKAGAIRRRIVEEQEELVDRAVRECLISDQACQEVLGWNHKFYEEIMAPLPNGIAKGKEGLAGIIGSWEIPNDIMAADARVRRLRLYDENSIQAREGMAKLRAIVGAVMPYIDGDTGVTEDALKEARDIPPEGVFQGTEEARRGAAAA